MPQIARLREGRAFCFPEGGLEVEALQAVAVLLRVESLEERIDLVGAEARDREVHRVHLRSASILASSSVPVAADLGERQVEEMALLGREVHEDDRDRLEAEAPGGDEALVAADDYVVIVPGANRLNEAPLTETASEGFQLGSADLAGVGRVGM